MHKGRKQAFTIIELVLFVSISATMILVAILAISGRQTKVQFTDAMRSLHSFIDLQQTAAATGVNDTSEPSSTGDRITLGRILVFETNSSNIRYHSVSGARLSAVDEVRVVSPETILSIAGPSIIDDRSYEILWQVRFSGGRHKIGTSGVQPTSAFGFLRNPRGTNLFGVSYDMAPLNLTIQEVINNAASYRTGGAADFGETVDAYYCFSELGGPQRAVISLKGSATNLIFEPPSNEFPGCWNSVGHNSNFLQPTFSQGRS